MNKWYQSPFVSFEAKLTLACYRKAFRVEQKRHRWDIIDCSCVLMIAATVAVWTVIFRMKGLL